MSYAKVMASLNASSADVEVKKRAPDGSYVPADDRDFATADFDAELEAAVKAVQRLPRDERLAYGKAMRVEGNAQFARGDHADAIRTRLPASATAWSASTGAAACWRLQPTRRARGPTFTRMATCTAGCFSMASC